MICNKLWECCDNNTDKQYDWCQRCRTESIDSNITRIEQKKRYNLINKNHIPVIIFHVDGGVIHNEQNQSACDYLFVVRKKFEEKIKFKAIFVELKGKDISHALEQIENTIGILASKQSGSELEINARIICRSVPNILTKKIVECKKRIKKKHKAELLIISNSYDDDCLTQWS